MKTELELLALAFGTKVGYFRIFRETQYHSSVEYMAWSPTESHCLAPYLLDGEIEYNGTAWIAGELHMGYTNGGRNVWIPC